MRQRCLYDHHCGAEQTLHRLQQTQALPVDGADRQVAARGVVHEAVDRCRAEGTKADAGVVQRTVSVSRGGGRAGGSGGGSGSSSSRKGSGSDSVNDVVVAIVHERGDGGQGCAAVTR